MVGRDEDEVNMEEGIEEFLQEPGVSSDEFAFPLELISKELKRIGGLLKQVPRVVNEEVREHKVSGRYKEKHAEIVRREVDKICEEVEMLASNCKTTTVIKQGIFKVLHMRGIETEEDWEQYICTIEKDGEILSSICEELNTDALQVVTVAKQLKEKADAPRYTDVDIEKDSNGECADSKKKACDGERDNLVLQSAPALRIGAPYESKWRHYAQTYSEEPRRQQGQSLTMDMLNCFQSLSCADPGVYKGKLNENFKEFVRRFRRKYQRVVTSDETLIEMLGDDHLGGRAKSVFLSLPTELKRRGFEVVIEELGKLLAEDSVAGRMRAIAELRELRIRPNQEVADFCVALEKLGRKANPQGRLEDSSLEFAHILLSNLREWPEYTQLLSALHRTTPEKAYEEVKQLALSIELSKRMYGGTYEREDRYRHWRLRAKAYSNKEESNVGKVSRSTEVRETRKEDTEIKKQGYLEMGSGNPQNHPPRTQERRSSGGSGPAERKYGDSKKCFKCSKFGHIAKECTQRTQVRRINESRERSDLRDTEGISRIIQKARSMGVKTAGSPKTSSPLVGKRMACWTRMLECRVPALLDTGSMISIVPVRVLARAKDRGFDVDRLELIKDDKNVPVYDASNNRMEFMGAVRIMVKLEGGRSSDVAFYIVDSCDDEVLLGTNALSDLGVDLTISQARSGIRKERGVETQTITVAKRIYIPPYTSKIVTARCDIEGQATEGVVWPSRKGLGCGIFKIRDQQLEMPAVNNSDKPMILGQGEEIGRWGTEKWTEKWEDVNPCVIEDSLGTISAHERRALLIEQIKQSSNMDEISDDVIEVLDDFPEAFSVSDRELTGTDKVTMDIDTGENKPIKMKARPVPLAVRKKLKELLTDLQNRRIIERSNSDWAFPIVLVEKKDGSLRLCVDYRELNKRIKQDSYPLPTLDAILQSMAGKRWFSTLDLCSGYWQIPLSDKAREKSAFTTTEGLFQFRVTPFGLSTSPAVFQRLMDTVLQELIGEEVFCYIDDIIICTESRSRHMELLRKVCAKLKEAGLRLKAQKCVLLKEQVSFLGHIIDAQGVHMDPKKVEAITEYPAPRDVKGLRTFLGMASFYRKFCLGFSKLAGCLFTLTSPRTPWKWTKEHDEAFENIKRMITSAPVLMQPDIERAREGTRPFIICTDASTTGLGAVLSQESDDKQLHPVYFASKSLSRAEKRYHVTDLEALAVIFAVRRFHMFIYGLPTIVLTDHQPLTALFKRNNVSARVLRWSLEIQRYKIEIKYVRGKTNVVADALSRGTAEWSSTMSLSGVDDAVVSKLEIQKESKWMTELREDPDFSGIVKAVLEGKVEGTITLTGSKQAVRIADFVVEDGELKMYRSDGKLVFVIPRSARQQIFQEAHAGTFAGHFSAYKLYNRLKREVFWPTMLQDIRRWTRECQLCFVHNPKSMVTPPLKPIVTTKPYEIVGVDILELGLTTSGNRYAVTVIDHFSKFAAAYPVADKSAETVAKVLFMRWIAEGCRWPKKILSDKGGEFENKVMTELTKITKIEHVTTKGYNPRENGLTERLNGTIVAMLRRSTVTPMEWDVRLPFCLMAYNMTPHRSTGESPYFVLHGMDPHFPSAIIPNGGISWYTMDKSLDDYKAQLLQAVAESHERIQEYNKRVREQMKLEYDKRHKVDARKHAKIGDRVYLFAPNEKGLSDHPKFTCEWSGPFRVLETSANSALISRIGSNEEPIRVQFDMLRIVPNSISDEPIGTKTKRGKRGRKPTKYSVCSTKVLCCRGATLLSPLEKGHLLFLCGNGCFDGATLKEIENTSFPGAVAREPKTTLWEAWLAASIFRRTDISTGEKIRMHREGAVCYEAEALKDVLKMAYEKCIDWTDFIMNTERITQHSAIQGHCVETSYEEALRAVRQELKEDVIKGRPRKEGYVGYIAGEGALALEKDGRRGEIVIKMATTFDRVLEILEEWSTFRTWVIMWPIDPKMDEEKLKKLLKLVRSQINSGGKVVTIWPPVNERNMVKWRAVQELWSAMDTMLQKIDDGNQFFATAGSKIMDGKLYIEAGSPEGSAQFCSGHVGAGVPKAAFEAARKRAVGAMLPALPDSRFLTSRAMSTPREGVLVRGERPVKRQYGRDHP